VDSSRARPSRPAPTETAAPPPLADGLALADLPPVGAPPDDGTVEVSPQTAARIGRIVPLVRRGERVARRVATVSAGAGVLTAALLLGEPLLNEQIWWPLAAAIALALVAPATLTWLGAGAMRDVVELPGRLRTGAAEAAQHARAAVRPGAEDDTRVQGRLFGVVRALWAARSVVTDAREGGWRVLALARLVRLSSLPFVFMLIVAFFLNFAVIAAAFFSILIVVLT